MYGGPLGANIGRPKTLKLVLAASGASVRDRGFEAADYAVMGHASRKDEVSEESGMQGLARGRRCAEGPCVAERQRKRRGWGVESCT